MKLLALAPAEQLIESLRSQRANLTAVGLYESANEATSAESFQHEHDVLRTSCRPKSWKKDSQLPLSYPYYCSYSHFSVSSPPGPIIMSSAGGSATQDAAWATYAACRSDNRLGDLSLELDKCLSS